MKNKLYQLVFGFTILFAVATANRALAQDTTLRPLPGAEYKDGALKRAIRKLPIENLVEGSPEWIYWKLMQARLDRNYDLLKDYVSPVKLWNYKNEGEPGLADLKNEASFSDPIYLGDAGSDENSAYVYISLPKQSDKERMGFDYAFFLKKDGRWIFVTNKEWREGKMKPAPTF